MLASLFECLSDLKQHLLALTTRRLTVLRHTSSPNSRPISSKVLFFVSGKNRMKMMMKMTSQMTKIMKYFQLMASIACDTRVVSCFAHIGRQ